MTIPTEKEEPMHVDENSGKGTSMKDQALDRIEADILRKCESYEADAEHGGSHGLEGSSIEDQALDRMEIDILRKSERCEKVSDYDQRSSLPAQGDGMAEMMAAEQKIRSRTDQVPARAKDSYESHEGIQPGAVYVPWSEDSSEGDRSLDYLGDNVLGKTNESEGGGDNHEPSQGLEQSNLNIAVAVEDHEQYHGTNLPEAVEFDPHSNPPILKNRRFRLYGTLGICLIILVALASLVFILFKPDESPNLVSLALAPSLEPSPSPTTDKDSEYRAIFALEVGDSVYEPGTAHHMAADWIIHKDPLQLEASAGKLIQRYILAFLYFHFSNGGKSKWRFCNPPEEGETDECSHSDPRWGKGGIFVYDEFIDDGIRWLTGKDECDWLGVICLGTTDVIALELDGQNLTGSLPVDVLSLSSLQYLSFEINKLTGTIPAEYSQLKHLVDVEVHYNELTGTIPDSFYTKGGSPLRTLNVGSNLMTGTISTQIGLLTGLRGLHVFENLFSGTMPSEIGNMDQLAYTRWNSNGFTGTFPVEITSLPKLEELFMQDNTISGTLLDELGDMTRLETFSVRGNELTGTLPKTIYDMSSMRYLDVEENQLTGTISTKIGQLTDLYQLRISRNPFTGTIPTELGGITGLGLAWMHLTQMSGTVPTEMCENRGGFGRLEILQTDCTPIENPAIPCRCCTACCVRATGFCSLVN